MLKIIKVTPFNPSPQSAPPRIDVNLKKLTNNTPVSGLCIESRIASTVTIIPLSRACLVPSTALVLLFVVIVGLASVIMFDVVRRLVPVKKVKNNCMGKLVACCVAYLSLVNRGMSGRWKRSFLLVP